MNAITVDSVTVESVARTCVKIGNHYTATESFLGEMTKSRARKFRKAFRKAGWYSHAAVKAFRVPCGWKRHTWSMRILLTDEEEE